MSLARYDLEIVCAASGEEESLLWRTQQQVISAVRKMQPGDSLVISRRDDALEGVTYL